MKNSISDPFDGIPGRSSAAGGGWGNWGGEQIMVIPSMVYEFDAVRQSSTSMIIEIVTIPLCPDLLRYDQLGEADNLRGRVVRAFFWLMRVWPGKD